MFSGYGVKLIVFIDITTNDITLYYITMTTGNARKTRRILERTQAKETKKTQILENTRNQEKNTIPTLLELAKNAAKNTKQTVLELATLKRIRAMPADILRYIWEFVPSTVKDKVMNLYLRSIMREQIEYMRNKTYKEPGLSRLLRDVPLHIIEKLIQTPTIETLYAEICSYSNETMHEYGVKITPNEKKTDTLYQFSIGRRPPPKRKMSHFSFRLV